MKKSFFDPPEAGAKIVDRSDEKWTKNNMNPMVHRLIKYQFLSHDKLPSQVKWIKNDPLVLFLIPTYGLGLSIP